MRCAYAGNKGVTNIASKANANADALSIMRNWPKVERGERKMGYIVSRRPRLNFLLPPLRKIHRWPAKWGLGRQGAYEGHENGKTCVPCSSPA